MNKLNFFVIFYFYSLEFLRTIGHLRPRTNTFGAVARISSCLTAATHQFFQNEGFLHVHTPIITSSDCEGAGEMFRVSTSPPQEINNNDQKNKTNKNSSQQNDSFEFFGKPTFLTVSGQVLPFLFFKNIYHSIYFFQ